MKKRCYASMEKKDLDSFKNASRKIFPLFKEANLNLDFTGYSSIIVSLDQTWNVQDLDALFQLSLELLFWINYFEDITVLTKSLGFQKKNQFNYLCAFKNLKRSNVELYDKISRIEKEIKYFIFYEKVLIRETRKLKMLYASTFNSFSKNCQKLTFGSSS